VALLLTTVLTPDSVQVYIGLTIYWKNTTACLETNHKQWAAKLLKLLIKCLLIMTFEIERTVRFNSKFRIMAQNLIWFKMKKTVLAPH